MANDELAVIDLPQQRREDGDNKPTCTICTCIFHSKDRVPKSLSCGHSFCQECLAYMSRQLAAPKDKLPCPTCRKPHPIKIDELLTSFPTNFALKELIEKDETSEPWVLEFAKSQCSNCKTLECEKDLILCETCNKSKSGHDQASQDFMGRPRIQLVCWKCIREHHIGHNYPDRGVIAGRWLNREIFTKFEKVAKEEETRMEKLRNALLEAVAETNKYSDNLAETVRQIEENAGTTHIRNIIRNFMKAAKESSNFVDMTTECITRFMDPNAPQNTLLGNKLFNYSAKKPAVDTHYKRTISRLFLNMKQAAEPPNNFRAPTLASNQPSTSMTTGTMRPLNSSASVQPLAQSSSVRPLAPSASVQPSGPSTSVQPFPHRRVMEQITINNQLRAVSTPPPMPQFSTQSLNNVIDYFCKINAQDKESLCNQLTYKQGQGMSHEDLTQARRRVLNIASTYMSHFREVNGGEQFKIQTVYDFPFHVFNVYYTSLYGETLRSMISHAINDLVTNCGKAEVNRYFFEPPYDPRELTQYTIPEVRTVLAHMKKILFEGNHLYTKIVQMEAALPVSRIAPVRNVQRPILQNPQNLEDTPVVINEVVVPAVREQQPPVRQGPHDTITLDENEDDIVPAGGEAATEYAQADERGNEELQRNPDNVFQLEDLFIEPPSRSTRGAKRRADTLAAAAAILHTPAPARATAFRQRLVEEDEERNTPSTSSNPPGLSTRSKRSRRH